MGEIRHSIDWYQASVKWPDAIWEWPLDQRDAYPILSTCVPHLDTTGWEPTRDDGYRVLPMAGYPKTYDLLYASGHVDPNRREQKIGVRFTGQNMAAYRDLGGTEGRLLEFYSKIGGKCSRIDIAFDLFGYDIDPMRIYQDWTKDKVQTKARSAQPFTKSTKNADGTITSVSTCYVGTRESDEMWRIYDKGAQMQVDAKWIRIEGEFKGDKAPVVSDDCRRLGVDVVGKQLLRNQFKAMPYRFWKELTTGASTPLTPVGRKVTAHEAWVLNIVLPMLADDMAKEWESAHDSGITRNIEGLIRSQWTRRMMAIREQYAWWEHVRKDNIAAD